MSRLPSLDKKSKGSSKLVAPIDQSSLRETLLRPHKKLPFDFNDEVLVDTVDPLSFVSSWPGLLERLEVLSQPVILFEQSVSSNITGELNSL